MTLVEMPSVTGPISNRMLSGLVAPYHETSFLTPHLRGERIAPGAFRRHLEALEARHDSIFLFRNHDHDNPVGKSIRFTETPGGLVGEFRVRDTPAGDQVLLDVAEGFLPAFSGGWMTTRSTTDAAGVRVVTEARLMEVSLVPIGAYDEARVLATRRAQLLAGFTPGPRPDIDLSPTGLRLPSLLGLAARNALARRAG